MGFAGHLPGDAVLARSDENLECLRVGDRHQMMVEGPGVDLVGVAPVGHAGLVEQADQERAIGVRGRILGPGRRGGERQKTAQRGHGKGRAAEFQLVPGHATEPLSSSMDSAG